MSKNVMAGGYTNQEARNLLLIRGIEHVKSIIPHNVQKNANLSEFEDLPQFWFDGDWWEIADYEHWLWNAENYGEIHGIAVRLDVTLCYSCAFAIRDYFNHLSPSLHFRYNVQRGNCEICGKFEPDDIPF